MDQRVSMPGFIPAPAELPRISWEFEPTVTTIRNQIAQPDRPIPDYFRAQVGYNA
jgi:hypothetical protein